MTHYRITYPQGHQALVPRKWQAENMVKWFGGSWEELPGSMDERDSDPMLDHDRANDEAWDAYDDNYHRGVPESDYYDRKLQ